MSTIEPWPETSAKPSEYTPSGISPDYTPDGIYSPRAILPEHAEAFKAWLLERVKLVDSGQAVHEVASEMLLTVRIASRRI